MNPGINEESFELHFEEDWIKQSYWLESQSSFWWKPVWYLRVLGFKYYFQLFVLENPVQEGMHFKYKVKMQKRYLYWFNWKIKEFKTK